ncbi:MAG: hypothetical protein KGQ66_11510 [Acidobacteriota bacterium]|nr:hypothetical protein [Acidobacteriota bacterium]
MRTLAELVPLRSAACRGAEGAVVALAAGDVTASRAGGGHVATCLRCQAEVAAYRRVMVVMRSMRDDRLPVGPATSDETVLGLHAVLGPDGRWGPGAEGAIKALWAAWVGGLTAAGAAGLMVWMARRRPGLAQIG